MIPIDFRFVLVSTLAVYHGTCSEPDYNDLEYINVSPVRHIFLKVRFETFEEHKV